MSAPSQGDIEQVCRILSGALSNNSNERQQAEAALAELSSREGFCSCLLVALQLSGVDTSTKWLAAVQLKNHVTNRWACHAGGTASTAITDAEKQYIRSNVLSLVGLSDAKLGVHVAVVISKIARHDFATRWPALFEQLIAPVLQPPADDLISRRTWLTLHHVIKELSTKRLPADKKRLQQLTQQLLPTVWQSWTSGAQTITSSLEEVLVDTGGKGVALTSFNAAFESWMLESKVMRRLIMNGLQRCAPLRHSSMHHATHNA
jgi:hypothetical protein